MINPLLQTNNIDPGFMPSPGSFDPGALFGLAMGFMVIFLVVGLIMYIYLALTLMSTAKKLKVEPAWLAWIPVGNLYLMSKMAKMAWWPVLLVIGFIIPILNFFAIIVLDVFVIIWLWKICEARSKPGWFALLMLIPVVNLIILGILAWGK